MAHSKCPFKRAYTQQKSNAKQRGVDFKITFDEWQQVWISSGKWDQRGRGAGKYCMCRTGDEGAYEVGNVFIDLNTKNISDGNLGRVIPQSVRDKISKTNSGVPHPWSAGANSPMHRPECKLKMAKGIKHYKAKGVITPNGWFETTKQASIATGVNHVTVQWRCRHNKSGFSYGNNTFS